MAVQLSKQLIQIIESLNEAQLQAVHRLIIDRLELMHRVRTFQAMRQFHVLDRVVFNYNGQEYEGTVTRLNQKTIAVVLDNGNRWNVTPGALTKVEPVEDLTQKLVPKLKSRRR